MGLHSVLDQMFRMKFSSHFQADFLLLYSKFPSEHLSQRDGQTRSLDRQRLLNRLKVYLKDGKLGKKLSNSL